MTKPIAEATGRRRLHATARASPITAARTSSASTDGKPFVRVAGGIARRSASGRLHAWFKRYQGYLSTLPDGRIYVLPVFWHIESRRWVDWKEITPIPDGAHDLRQIWNTNCFNCHATNLVAGLQRRRRALRDDMDRDGHRLRGVSRPRTTARRADGGVGEGPGVKPAYDNSAKNRELSAILKTFSPRSGGAAAGLRHVRVLPRQQDRTCSSGSAAASVTRISRCRF